MINLDIRYVDNKIIGYNTKLLEREKPYSDYNSVEGKDEELVKKYFLEKPMYLINGKVVILDNPPVYERDVEYTEVIKELAEVSDKVSGDNEYKTFMDNIVAGMSIEDATKVTKEYRERLQILEAKQKEIRAAIDEDEIAGRLKYLEDQESKITYKYFLSGVAVVRDENDYLPEWIRYHIEEMGFDHFYIYDNESTVSVQEYLKSINFKYLDHVTVEVFQTTEELQRDAYHKYLIDHKDDSKWIFAFDPDEYVVINDKSKTLIEWLQENHEFGSVLCQWKHFNANGQVHRTEGTDMERFTHEIEFEKEKYRGKEFAQANRIIGYLIHTPICKSIAIPNRSHSQPVNEFFQLNHYITRSFDEYVERKMKRGTSTPGHTRKYSDFFKLNPDLAYLDDGTDFDQPYGSKAIISEEEE